MIVENMVEILGTFFSEDFSFYWFYPLVCVYLIGCVPALIRYVSSWR